MSNTLQVSNLDGDDQRDSIHKISKNEPSTPNDEAQTKQSTQKPIHSVSPYNADGGEEEVPSLSEVMKLIGSVNADNEISKMLDAFYVNDQAELKFFSDIRPPAKVQNTGALSPMNQSILASSVVVDKLDEVNVIMANNQELGIFDGKKGKANH